MRKLEIKYIFFRWFRDVNKFEELEMDTGSLYLAFADKQLCDWTFQASAQNGLKSETRTVETLEKIQKQLVTHYSVLAVPSKKTIRENPDCSSGVQMH